MESKRWLFITQKPANFDRILQTPLKERSFKTIFCQFIFLYPGTLRNFASNFKNFGEQFQQGNPQCQVLCML